MRPGHAAGAACRLNPLSGPADECRAEAKTLRDDGRLNLRSVDWERVPSLLPEKYTPRAAVMHQLADAMGEWLVEPELVSIAHAAGR